MRIPFIHSVSINEKAFFAQQLSTMINAGLPLTRSLDILGQQTKNPVLKDVILEVTSDLEEGVSFSKAISKHPQVFNNVFVSIIRSGETSGKLDVVLSELAKQQESDARFTSKLRSAMLYPIFILVAMLGVGALMMVKVVPQITQIFKESNAQLPWATRVLIATSDFMVKDWWLVLAVIFVLIISLRFYIRTEQGKYAYNYLQIYFPLFKQLSSDLFMTRLTRTMSMLVGSGVEIIKAVGIVADVMNNGIYKESLKQVSSQIERGIPMSVPLSQNPLFPILLSQMIAVGEQTGKLDEVLKNLANYYQEETDNKMRGVTALVEPIIIIILGLGVGIMVFSVLMPIYNLAQIQ